MELNIYVVNLRTGVNKTYSGYNFETKNEVLHFCSGLSIGFGNYQKNIGIAAYCEGEFFHSFNWGDTLKCFLNKSESEFVKTLSDKKL